MYHICRYVTGSWNIYCDTTSSSTGCYDTLQKALSRPFCPVRYNLEEFKKKIRLQTNLPCRFTVRY